MWHGQLWVWAPVWPTSPPMFADTSVSMWIDKARLPGWPLYSQQVSHQRWMWGSHKWKSTQGIHPGFETQGRHHQNSKTGVSVAPWKGLMSSKIYLKQKRMGYPPPSWEGLFWCCLGVVLLHSAFATATATNFAVAGESICDRFGSDVTHA